jgi:acetoin utilization protein AcuC
MTCTLHVAWDEALTQYDFGPGHPMAPIRVKLTMELARAFGILDGDSVSVRTPRPATDAELGLVHDPGYIAMVRQAGRWAAQEAGGHASGAPPDPLRRTALMFGLGTEDDPIFPGMHEASALAAGATLAAARAVWSGDTEHGANIAGGLHHAMRSNAAGFCVYNDPAIAIAWLLEQGAERVAYVDIDVHHGDGVQTAFWDDPRVLTISLHQHPASLFPGTGLPSESGGPRARGSAVNVALPAGTRSPDWLRAFHAVVPPLVREFRPQILVSQHGCDTHWSDPLASLEVTIDAQRAAHAAIHQLAHDAAGGRWVLTGGGGYQLVQVVPRSWTHLLAEAAGTPVDPGAATPGRWREYVRQAAAEEAPELMTEGEDTRFADFEAGYDPADPTDRAIIAARQASFGQHGLVSPPLTAGPTLAVPRITPAVS